MAGLRAYLYHQLEEGAEGDGHLTWMNRLLVTMIVLAVVTAVLATEPALDGPWHRDFVIVEALFGAVFLAEYLARLFAAPERPGPESDLAKRWRFVRSPLGLLDLVVIATTLLPMFVANSAVLRMVRLLRVVAAMKFGRFSQALREIRSAIAARVDDLVVVLALGAVVMLIAATGMFFAEGESQPAAFGSILRSLYWAAITLTAVGYGDVVPITPLGKVLAAVVATTGIALVAMPIGIIAAAFSDAMQHRRDLRIEELQRHIAELDVEDERIEAKLAALQRLSRAHK